MSSDRQDSDAEIEVELVIDPPAAGVWNMAVDEALLETAAARGQAVWRFYQWEEATVSLGYFQRYVDRSTHAPSSAVPLVRRLSGGGAIVHDRELTYSLTLPPGHLLAVDTQRLYNQVHSALISTLANYGIDARLNDESPPASQADPFLCFQRRATGDVLLDQFKITGSAQRRRHGAILQHGSVLLQTSHAAPELPGIEQLRSVRLAPTDLVTPWTRQLSQQLKLRFTRSEITPELTQRAERFVKEKYLTPQWNKSR